MCCKHHTCILAYLPKELSCILSQECSKIYHLKTLPIHNLQDCFGLVHRSSWYLPQDEQFACNLSYQVPITAMLRTIAVCKDDEPAFLPVGVEHALYTYILRSSRLK